VSGRQEFLREVSSYAVGKHTATTTPNGFGDLSHGSGGAWAVKTLEKANSGRVHVFKLDEQLLQQHHVRAKGAWGKGSCCRQQFLDFFSAFNGIRTDNFDVAGAHSDRLGWCSLGGE